MKRRAKNVEGMCANALIFYRRANTQSMSAPSLSASRFDNETSFGPNCRFGKYAALTLGGLILVMFRIASVKESRRCEVMQLSRGL